MLLYTHITAYSVPVRCNNITTENTQTHTHRTLLFYFWRPTTHANKTAATALKKYTV